MFYATHNVDCSFVHKLLLCSHIFHFFFQDFDSRLSRLEVTQTTMKLDFRDLSLRVDVELSTIKDLLRNLTDRVNAAIRSEGVEELNNNQRGAEDIDIKNVDDDEGDGDGDGSVRESCYFFFTCLDI